MNALFLFLKFSPVKLMNHSEQSAALQGENFNLSLGTETEIGE